MVVPEPLSREEALQRTRANNMYHVRSLGGQAAVYADLKPVTSGNAPG